VAEVLIEDGVSGSIPVEERPVGRAPFAKLERGGHRHRGQRDQQAVPDDCGGLAEPERDRIREPGSIDGKDSRVSPSRHRRPRAAGGATAGVDNAAMIPGDGHSDANPP
jgi:hypothetical protein